MRKKRKTLNNDCPIFHIGDVLTLRGRMVEVLGGDCIWFVEVKYLDDNSEGIITSEKVSDAYAKKLQEDYLRRKLKDVPEVKPVVKVSENQYKPVGHYVYFVRCEDQIVYIGSGKGDRYRTHIKGSSTSAFLNKLFFSDKTLSVAVEYDNLDKKSSLEIEKSLILKWKPEGNTQYLQ